MSLTLTGQVCVFAVGIAAEYHSTLVVVSKDKDFKIDIGTGEALVGTEKNPLFLFVEDIGGTRSFEKTEVALFLREESNGLIKGSMRSNGIDVNKIASNFGGGGHIKASGFTTDKKPEEVLEIVLNLL